MLGHGFDSRRLHLDEDETLRNVDMKRFIQLSRGYFFVVLQVDSWFVGAAESSNGIGSRLFGFVSCVNNRHPRCVSTV